MSLRVLDCTLRDGGYYNNWDFAPAVVRHYIEAVAAAGIDSVEIGFRFFTKDRFLGAHAYTTDAYLETLNLPASVEWGVMCNAADLVGYADGPAAAIDCLFQAASDSPIDLVRVAAHMTETAACEPAIRRLKALGYRVGFNLMQISEYDDATIRDAAHGGTPLNWAEHMGSEQAARLLRARLT